MTITAIEREDLIQANAKRQPYAVGPVLQPGTRLGVRWDDEDSRPLEVTVLRWDGRSKKIVESRIWSDRTGVRIHTTPGVELSTATSVGWNPRTGTLAMAAAYAMVRSLENSKSRQHAAVHGMAAARRIARVL